MACLYGCDKEEEVLVKRTGLSLMAAGSISNMFDRLVRGHVVDYVGFRLEDKHLEGITYNFADFFIAAGAVITVMTKLFRPGSKRRKAKRKCLKSENVNPKETKQKQNRRRYS